jgi:hypothetical protein
MKQGNKEKTEAEIEHDKIPAGFKGLENKSLLRTDSSPDRFVND